MGKGYSAKFLEQCSSQSIVKVLDLSLLMLLLFVNVKPKRACFLNFGRYFTSSLAKNPLPPPQMDSLGQEKNFSENPFESVTTGQLILLICTEFNCNFRWTMAMNGHSWEIIDLTMLGLAPGMLTSLPRTTNHLPRWKLRSNYLIYFI